MRDVDDELIKRGGLIMVDSKEACLQESGEIIRAGLGSEGLIELGALLGKEASGLRSRISESGDVTIFKSVSPNNQLFITERLFLPFGSFFGQIMSVSVVRADVFQVGVGIQDIAIASLVLEQAEKMNLGTTVPNYD